jgi:hypothetical protein
MMQFEIMRTGMTHIDKFSYQMMHFVSTKTKTGMAYVDKFKD